MSNLANQALVALRGWTFTAAFNYILVESFPIYHLGISVS